MDKKLELLLRALCAYEIDGEANFSLKCLDFFGSESTIRRNIQKLEAMNENGIPIIEKTNLNGLFSRYTINKVLDCPEFIYKNGFDITYKCILLALYNNRDQLPETLTISSIARIAGLSYNTIKKYWNDHTLDDLNNYSRPIKLSLTGELENSECGLKYVGQRKENYKCQYCGEDNLEMFYSDKHCICKKCYLERRKSKLNEDMAKKLFRNSKKSYQARTHINNYNLTEEYIRNLLEKQEYKCYYTKTKLEVGSKLTNPTLDRLDSSKGYIQGNVVVCTEIANIMKHTLTIDELKTQIKLFSDNINNF